MPTATLFPNAPDITASDYCVFGLATCFLKQEGEFQQIDVIEPIPSAALEAILQGIPTSYRWACAKLIGDLLAGDVPQKPAEFPTEAEFCENFAQRSLAAARTYKSRSDAQSYIALGSKKADFNYSLERKRVLNAINVVNTEDNIKQHPHTHQVL